MRTMRFETGELELLDKALQQFGCTIQPEPYNVPMLDNLSSRVFDALVDERMKEQRATPASRPAPPPA